MSKLKLCGLYAALFVCLCFSVSALCRTFPSQNLNFDYLGFLVGVLGVITTILIGWNIYTLIDLNRIGKKFEDMSKNLDAINSMSYERDHAFQGFVQYEFFVVYHSKLIGNTTSSMWYRYFYHAASSIYHSSLAGNIANCNKVISTTLSNIPPNVYMKKEQRNEILKLLQNTKDGDKILNLYDLIAVVASFPSEAHSSTQTHQDATS